jgi:hypothetical protein
MVEKALENDRYLIVNVPGSPQTQKPFRSVYASDRMKHWWILDDEIETDEEHDLIEDDQLTPKL